MLRLWQAKVCWWVSATSHAIQDCNCVEAIKANQCQQRHTDMFAPQAADPDFSGSDDSDDSDFEADVDDEEEEEGSEADAAARSPFGGRAGWRCELPCPEIRL